MAKNFTRKENKNTITYINCELTEITNWLSEYLVIYESVRKYQFIEIHYIAELFKQYRTGEIYVNEIIKEVINNDEIKHNEINTNFIIGIITELAEFLNKYDDNILNKIKQVLYKAYLREAIEIIFSDNSKDDLNILFNKVSGLDIPIDTFFIDIDEYLENIIYNEDNFYNFIDQLYRFSSLKISFNNTLPEIELEESKEIESSYHDIEINIISLIGAE